MRLLGKSLVLIAAVAAAVLALSAFEFVPAPVSRAADPARAGHHETAGHEGWNPHGPTPGFTPPSATWGDVFNANWR